MTGWLRTKHASLRPIVGGAYHVLGQVDVLGLLCKCDQICNDNSMELIQCKIEASKEKLVVQ